MEDESDTVEDESVFDEGTTIASPGLAAALNRLRSLYDNGVQRTEYDKPFAADANEVLVLTHEGTQAYRHIPLMLDIMESFIPGMTGMPTAVNIPMARLSFIDAWAKELENTAERSSIKGFDAEAANYTQRATALRDVASTLRTLLGIDYTPVDTRPTMEIHDDLAIQRSDNSAK